LDQALSLFLDQSLEDGPSPLMCVESFWKDKVIIRHQISLTKG